MSRIPRIGKRAVALVVASLCLAMAGCSADDIEFNGSVFNAVGLGNKTKAAEPKLAQRSALVLPPDTQRLPEPGTQPGAESSDVASLNDPDAVSSQSEAELQRQQAEYCKVHYEQAKAHGDNEADQAAGPLGLCKGSLWTAIKNYNKSE